MRAFFSIFFFLSVATAHTAEPEAAPPLNASTKSRRYKLSDVKAPYDPFEKSMEASQPGWLSILATLGLVVFFRKGRIYYQDENARIAIEGTK